jgi:hypothetical protein
MTSGPYRPYRSKLSPTYGFTLVSFVVVVVVVVDKPRDPAIKSFGPPVMLFRNLVLMGIQGI